jgi:hypothetical protein
MTHKGRNTRRIFSTSTITSCFYGGALLDGCFLLGLFFNPEDGGDMFVGSFG